MNSRHTKIHDRVSSPCDMTRSLDANFLHHMGILTTDANKRPESGARMLPPPRTSTSRPSVDTKGVPVAIERGPLTPAPVPEMVAEKEQSVLDERLLSRIAVDPEVELLRYADVPRTVERMMYARNNSVLHHYIFGTPDAHKNPTLPYRDRIQLFLSWADGVRRRELLTVNRGDSLLLYSPAPESVPRRRKTTNKMIHGLIRRILSVFDPFYTKEQRKRMKELRETSAAAIEATLGQRVSELISIDNLVTAFEKQGLGYASTLVNYILDLAVEQKRSVWLLTNEHTVGFYARFGFKEVERYSLGEHNPTWTEDPVISCILLWEPESRAFDSETEESLHQPSPTLSALHAILWNPECKVTNLVPTLG